VTVDSAPRWLHGGTTARAALARGIFVIAELKIADISYEGGYQQYMGSVER